jgi:hypothetical protein
MAKWISAGLVVLVLSLLVSLLGPGCAGAAEETPPGQVAETTPGQGIEKTLGQGAINALTRAKNEQPQTANESDKIIGKISNALTAIDAANTATANATKAKDNAFKTKKPEDTKKAKNAEQDAKDKAEAAMKIKLDALGEINALLSQAEGENYKKDLKNAMDNIERMIEDELGKTVINALIWAKTDCGYVSGIVASTTRTELDNIIKKINTALTAIYAGEYALGIKWDALGEINDLLSQAGGKQNVDEYWEDLIYAEAKIKEMIDREEEFAALPPGLISPDDGAMVINTTPKFEWNASLGATSYGLQVATDSAFTNLVLSESGITDLYYDVPLGVLNWGTTCYWQVNATNAAGTSAWSDYWSFMTAAPPPPTPILKAPLSSSIVLNRMPTVEWNASTEATSYGLQIATDSAFTDLVLSGSGITDLYDTVPLGVLNWNTTYYWRVNATNAAGTSAWSDYWQFTTPS